MLLQIKAVTSIIPCDAQPAVAGLANAGLELAWGKETGGQLGGRMSTGGNSTAFAFGVAQLLRRTAYRKGSFFQDTGSIFCTINRYERVATTKFTQTQTKAR